MYNLNVLSKNYGLVEKGLQAQYINIPINYVGKIYKKIFLQSICAISVNFVP